MLFLQNQAMLASSARYSERNYFNFSNNHITVANNILVDAAFTISWWGRASNTTSVDAIWDKFVNTNDNRVSLYFNADSTGAFDNQFMLLQTRDGATTTAAAWNTGGLHNDGLWHHFAVASDGVGACELVIDGVSEGTGSSSTGDVVDETSGHRIGCQRNAALIYSGDLYLFRVWSVVKLFSADEVAAPVNLSSKYADLKLQLTGIPFGPAVATTIPNNIDPANTLSRSGVPNKREAIEGYSNYGI